MVRSKSPPHTKFYSHPMEIQRCKYVVLPNKSLVNHGAYKNVGTSIASNKMGQWKWKCIHCQCFSHQSKVRRNFYMRQDDAGLFHFDVSIINNNNKSYDKQSVTMDQHSQYPYLPQQSLFMQPWFLFLKTMEENVSDVDEAGRSEIMIDRQNNRSFS
jgi:hypothetical protein